MEPRLNRWMSHTLLLVDFVLDSWSVKPSIVYSVRRKTAPRAMPEICHGKEVTLWQPVKILNITSLQCAQKVASMDSLSAHISTVSSVGIPKIQGHTWIKLAEWGIVRRDVLRSTTYTTLCLYAYHAPIQGPFESAPHFDKETLEMNGNGPTVCAIFPQTLCSRIQL